MEDSAPINKKPEVKQADYTERLLDFSLPIHQLFLNLLWGYNDKFR